MTIRRSVADRAVHAMFVIALLLLPVSLTAGTAQETGTPAPAPSAPLDINTASAEQLTSIVMDEELAQRIIENRPYANKRQLVSRDLVSEEEYERIKDRIIARRVSAEP